MCFHAFGQCFCLLLDITLQKTRECVKELSLSFLFMKRNKKIPTGSVFIAAFVQADSRRIMHSLWAMLQDLGQCSRF